ncbi:MAG: DNA alkylation repair protein [Cyanobacteriota bacterium]
MTLNSKCFEEIIDELKSQSNEFSRQGMARYGIDITRALGVSIPSLRKIARKAGKNHALALYLWQSDIHEARMLASMVDEIKKVTPEQMDQWALDFCSWDVCDQVCNNLFKYTDFAFDKAFEWAKRDEEFVKRAGFVLMATLAVGNKSATDEQFEQFFPFIIEESTDYRNFVKKAVNWALRQIGKRNLSLNEKCIKIAEEISQIDSKSARWIASNALKELKSSEVKNRLIIKSNN